MVKKINIVFILIVLSFTYCKSDNNKKTKSVQESPEFKGVLIGKPLESIQSKELQLGNKLEFKVVEIINIDINGDNKNDAITLEQIKDWGDPGDFHKVTIKIAGKDERTFFNSSGWVAIGGYETQFVGNLLTEAIYKSKYISLQKVSNSEILLFCFGYVYASQPGLLSIINLTNPNNAELIFNDNFYLYKLKDIDNDNKKDIIVTKDDVEEISDKSNLKSFKLLNGWYQEK